MENKEEKLKLIYDDTQSWARKETIALIIGKCSKKQ